MALEDAQRTMGLVRFHAAEWHINPHKTGVLGFSAGGHAFGQRCVKFPITAWPELAEKWLASIGMISQ